MVQNRLILGNCFYIIKNIPDNSVDFIITDPPFQTVLFVEIYGYIKLCITFGRRNKNYFKN